MQFKVVLFRKNTKMGNDNNKSNNGNTIDVYILGTQDNEFSMDASLPFGPSMTTDIDYYQTF